MERVQLFSGDSSRHSRILGVELHHALVISCRTGDYRLGRWTIYEIEKSMKVFIIPGYGIPESLERDQNYVTYLHVAFNRISESAHGENALIIPCGGPTNCTAPYEGTEAAMIGEYMQKLIDHAEMGDRCNAWTMKLEDQSLSTLENLVFAKHMIDEAESVESMTVFCEATRRDRVLKLSEVIFGSSTQKAIESIDFDTSANRYLDPAIIERKEQLELEGSLWVLQQPDRLVQHHQLFERKFALLRSLQSAGMSHVDAVAEWYRHAPTLIAELMPDHPGFKKERKGIALR